MTVPNAEDRGSYVHKSVSKVDMDCDSKCEDKKRFNNHQIFFPLKLSNLFPVLHSVVTLKKWCERYTQKVAHSCQPKSCNLALGLQGCVVCLGGGYNTNVNKIPISVNEAKLRMFFNMTVVLSLLHTSQTPKNPIVSEVGNSQSTEVHIWKS